MDRLAGMSIVNGVRMRLRTTGGHMTSLLGRRPRMWIAGILALAVTVLVAVDLLLLAATIVRLAGCS